MKIAVITHLGAMTAMCRSWMASGAQVVEWAIPTVKMVGNPPLKAAVARYLRQEILCERPDIIVDVNAAGILPLEPGRWTVDLVEKNWCTWWWDAPHTVVASPYVKDLALTEWVQALKRPSVVHWMWDAELARETAVWWQRPVYWLPTATNTILLHPGVGSFSKLTIEAVDVTFLGEFYTPPAIQMSPETSRIVEERLAHPHLTYFDIAARRESELPRFSTCLNLARQRMGGIVAPDILQAKMEIESHVGWQRRCEPLLHLHPYLRSTRFGGKGFPSVFNAQTFPITLSTDIAACYQRARLNLDLGNKQSFSGTAIRCYDVMSSGAVLLCRAHPDFDPTGQFRNQAYLAFDSNEDLIEMCRQFAADDGTLRMIAANAREFVVSGHTWTHRLVEMLRQLSERLKAKEAA